MSEKKETDWLFWGLIIWLFVLPALQECEEGDDEEVRQESITQEEILTP